MFQSNHLIVVAQDPLHEKDDLNVDAVLKRADPVRTPIDRILMPFTQHDTTHLLCEGRIGGKVIKALREMKAALVSRLSS